MGCFPHIIANSDLGKKLGLTEDTKFNNIQEVVDFIDTKNLSINTNKATPNPIEVISEDYGVKDFYVTVPNNQNVNQSTEIKPGDNSLPIFTTNKGNFTYNYDPNTDIVTQVLKNGAIKNVNNGIKGKILAEYAVENKLGVVHFNKQVYTKVGSTIVNIKTGSVVTQREIKKLFRASSESEDSLTSIILNEEQKKALQEIESFISSKDKKTHSLIGYAGTGKTTLINKIAEMIENKGLTFVQSSPTHRANSVIKLKNPKANVQTLHSLLGLQLDQDLETFDVKTAKYTQINKMYDKLAVDFLIVDEASMINDELYELLQNKLEEYPKLKILYVGDNAQIKPVGQSKESKALSSTNGQSNLTTVERANNNALLQESMAVRKIGDFSGIDNMDNTKGVAYTEDKNVFMDKAISMLKSEEFKNNPLLLRVLSGTNLGAKEANNKIRTSVFGENTEEYVVGDIIMGYTNWNQNFKSKISILNNSGDYHVTKSEKTTKTLANVNFKGYNITLQNSLNIEEKPFEAFIISRDSSEKDIEALGEEFERLRQIAISYKDNEAAAQYWQELNNFKNSFMTPVDIKYKGLVKIEKTLDYGYAHTIHKSQGGTYRFSFILADTIDSFKDVEIKKQLKYVAITRAEEGVFILKNNKNNTKGLENILNMHRCK